MPEHQYFGRYRPVAAEQHDDQAECPPGQHVDDLEQHLLSQPSCVQSVGDRAGQPPNRVFERYKTADVLLSDLPHGLAGRDRAADDLLLDSHYPAVLPEGERPTDGFRRASARFPARVANLLGSSLILLSSSNACFGELYKCLLCSR